MKGPISLSLLAHLLAVVHATATPSTLQACDTIDAALPGRVSRAGSIPYFKETRAYWSTALHSLRPACLVLPESADEVATVVGVLNQFPSVEFAVKSGGHDPNPGHATARDGILIATRKLSGATYDPATGLASVGPGGEFNDVMTDLEPHGVTIVGGRLGVVGVGGFVLQGGLSFLSAQHGLAADNVVGWETVMANGSVVNVDAAAHPELATAMKGGGSQFGIVTRFKIRTYPIGEVWGGYRIYDPSQATKIFEALHAFAATGAQDPKAAIIETNLILVTGLKSHLMYFFYDGPEPPSSGPFADFLKIPSLISTTKKQGYAKLLASNAVPTELLNERVSFRTYTIPFIPSFPGLYSTIWDKWHEFATTYLGNPLRITGQCSIDFQPFPSAIGAQSEAKGGNSMGLSGSDPDRFVLVMQCAWALAKDDALIYALSRDMTEWLAAQVPIWLAAANMTDTYNPLFMNDAQGDQNVTGSYRDYELFKQLQQEVDPNGLFSGRAGGFKY
ncbi:FAD-binding domain-containing protein [Poronia punctata]|nr:FAD-binding domain-containing protein [Poronia punctata]